VTKEERTLRLFFSRNSIFIIKLLFGI